MMDIKASEKREKVRKNCKKQVYFRIIILKRISYISEKNGQTHFKNLAVLL